MRKKRCVAVLLLLLGWVSLGSDCGGDGGGGMSGSLSGGTLIPSNAWTVAGDANREIFIQSDDDGETEGDFTGEERFLDSTPSNPLSGSWANGTIGFTVSRSSGDETYVATWTGDNPQQLEFTSETSGDKLTLLAPTRR